MKKIFFDVILDGINIFISEDNKIIVEKKINTPKPSTLIINAIKNILTECKLFYTDIDVFSTINGPGSFTSIKTNLAIIKTINIALKTKIIVFNLFDIFEYKQPNYDYIILDLNTVKYYIKEKKINSVYTVCKNDLIIPTNKQIITNCNQFTDKNMHHTNITNNTINTFLNFCIQNNNYTENINPLYIEEAKVTIKNK